MRQVFIDKGAVVVKEVVQPVLDEHTILVSVCYSFISSGTEIESLLSTQAIFFNSVPHKVKQVLRSVVSPECHPPHSTERNSGQAEIASIGYSCSGYVIAIGSKVKRLSIGDWVACAGAGYANHADLICVPERLAVRISHEKFAKAASISTIGGVALQALRRARLSLGDTVCIYGLGLIGQLLVQLAKMSGCRVIGIDIVQNRLELAHKMGADYVCLGTSPTLVQELSLITEGYGVDAALVTVTSETSNVVHKAIQVTKRKGRVVVVSDTSLHIDQEAFYQKEIDLLMTSAYGSGCCDPLYERSGDPEYFYNQSRWSESRNMKAFIQLIEANAIAIDPLISAEVGLEDIHDAYLNIQNKQMLGVVLRYRSNGSNTPLVQYKQTTSQPIESEIRFIPARNEKIRIGIIGAGGFAKDYLIPIMAKGKYAKINAVVDTDIVKSINVGRQCGIETSYTSDDDLYTNDLIDVVIISSPDTFHSQQAIKAMQHGKAVFVEKPMVINYDQFCALRSFLYTNPTIPFCVDYSRSFSPFIKKIKRLLTQRSTPITVYYRFNAGYVGKNHWVHTELASGKIIGEACHIFDLFCFLTDAKPVTISVESLHIAREDIFPTDNYVAHIRFSDGSLCSLLHTTLGNTDLGVERMELFCDGKSIVLDDYVRLFGFGVPSWFNETSTVPDRGHEALLEQFFDSVRSTHYIPPISLDRLALVAELTLIVDQLACQGGGIKELQS